MCLIWKLNRPVTMKRSTVGLKFSVLFFVPSILLLLCVVALSDWDSYCSGCNKWRFICGFANAEVQARYLFHSVYRLR